LYGCEEEHRLDVFENNAEENGGTYEEEVAGGW
jgi:hypothetical protein